MILEFKKNIKTFFGERGLLWLDSLPSIIEKISFQWNLSNLKLSSHLSYNYVLLGRQKDKDICLKISLDSVEFKRECSVLKYFNKYEDSPYVKLIDIDFELNCMLLEQVIPGSSLAKMFLVNDIAATDVFIKMCKFIKTSEISNLDDVSILPTVKSLLDHGINKEAAEFKDKISEENFLKIKESLYFVLKIWPDLDCNFVLHGDLHHLNILKSDGDFYKIIDPKGLIGPIEFEVGQFIFNPHDELFAHKDRKQIMIRRIDKISKCLEKNKEVIFHFFLFKLFLAQIWNWEIGINSKEHELILELTKAN